MRAGGALGLLLSLGVGGRGLLGSCQRLCSGFPAPSPESAKTSALGTELLDFINRRKFFDYPDSDEAKILAVAQFIQEEPVFFANAGMSGLRRGLLLVRAWRRADLGDECRVPTSSSLASRALQCHYLPPPPGGHPDCGLLLLPVPVLHSRVRPPSPAQGTFQGRGLRAQRWLPTSDLHTP